MTCERLEATTTRRRLRRDPVRLLRMLLSHNQLLILPDVPGAFWGPVQRQRMRMRGDVMNDWTDEDPPTQRKPKPCPDNCACQTEDAYTTPLDIEDYQ